MKMVFTADWHAHNFNDFAKTISVLWNESTLRYEKVDTADDFNTKEMNSRLFDILSGICDMRDYCLQNHIMEVLFGGDMFHHRGTIDVTVFNSIYRVLDSYYQTGINIHAIAGNHDQTDNSLVPTSAIHSFKELIHVIEQPEYFTVGDIEIVAIPYSKDKKFVMESMKQLRDKCKNPRQAILLCHLGINNGLVGSGMYMMSDEYSLRDLMYDKWKYVLAGHYHLGQFLEYNTVYSGTPVQCNFGDSRPNNEYNGFMVVDTDRRWDIEFVPIIAPRFITFSSVEELEQCDVDTIKSNYVRVKSKASQSDEIQNKLEDMLGSETHDIRLELEKEYAVDQRSEVSVTQSFDDAVKTYAQEKWETKKTLESVVAEGLDILHEAMTGGK